MAIYHLTIKNGSRSNGQSAIAASAYRSGSKLYDHEIGLYKDYSKRKDVVYSEVSLCNNAPEHYRDREKLWQSVHEIERASNARLWREVEVALPKELSREEQTETVREYVKTFTDAGMCADWSLHDKDDGNPHAHIMLTTRPIKESGEWGDKEKKDWARDDRGEKIPIIDEATGQQKVDKQNRKQWKREYVQVNDWNSRERVEEWREAWASTCNKRLKRLDEKKMIDHRSYVRQGLDIEPTIHEGYVARQIEKRGGVSDRCEYNRFVRAFNAIVREIKAIKDALFDLFMNAGKTAAELVSSAPIAPEPALAAGGIVPEMRISSIPPSYETPKPAEYKHGDPAQKDSSPPQKDAVEKATMVHEDGRREDVTFVEWDGNQDVAAPPQIPSASKETNKKKIHGGTGVSDIPPTHSKSLTGDSMRSKSAEMPEKPQKPEKPPESAPAPVALTKEQKARVSQLEYKIEETQEQLRKASRTVKAYETRDKHLEVYGSWSRKKNLPFAPMKDDYRKEHKEEIEAYEKAQRIIAKHEAGYSFRTPEEMRHYAKADVKQAKKEIENLQENLESAKNPGGGLEKVIAEGGRATRQREQQRSRSDELLEHKQTQGKTKKTDHGAI